MLLLAGTQVVIRAPGTTLDEHGWELPPDRLPVWWRGEGNFQPSPGITETAALDGGGNGPYEPLRRRSGELYLPSEARLCDGAVAELDGSQWVLSQVRYLRDPTGGPLGCWVATATEVAEWPA